MFRKLAALVVLGLLAAPAAHAQQEVRLYMAPVIGIFSFTPGQLDLAGNSDAGPVLRAGPADQGRLEAFLTANDANTLLIVRGNRVLREVPQDEDLYDANGVIPLVESNVGRDEADAIQAPDRIDIWAVGTSIDLTDKVEAVAPAQNNMGAGAVMLKLTPEGRDMLAALTSANAGRQIATLLERNILASPVVQGTVASDAIAVSFSSPEDPARERWVMDQLRAMAQGSSGTAAPGP
jgi:preprotein translocase subunit SecD